MIINFSYKIFGENDYQICLWIGSPALTPKSHYLPSPSHSSVISLSLYLQQSFRWVQRARDQHSRINTNHHQPLAYNLYSSSITTLTRPKQKRPYSHRQLYTTTILTPTPKYSFPRLLVHLLPPRTPWTRTPIADRSSRSDVILWPGIRGSGRALVVLLVYSSRLRTPGIKVYTCEFRATVSQVSYRR